MFGLFSGTKCHDKKAKMARKSFSWRCCKRKQNKKLLRELCPLFAGCTRWHATSTFSFYFSSHLPDQSHLAFSALSPAGPIIPEFLRFLSPLWKSLSFTARKMKMQVGMLQKLIFLILVSLFVVSGEKEEMLVVNNTYSQQPTRKEKQQYQRLSFSFDVFFSNKRKVPNASDPLHNRWAKVCCNIFLVPL